MNIGTLFSNIRFYVLMFSIIFSLAVFFYISSAIPEGSLQIIRLTQVYALTAITFLYLALLAGPFCYTFKFLPFRGHYIKARRALGVSVFYFGLLHGLFAFFGQLGSFAGLSFLDSKYLIAISLSFTALIILALMALTSFDYMVDKLTFPKWKILHRFVYVAGVLILIHALMLGTHFQDLSAIIPQIMFVAVGLLLVLETMRFDVFLQNKLSFSPKFGVSMLVVVSLIIVYLFNLFVPNNSFISLGIHSAHIQLAKQIQQGAGNPNLGNNLSNIPGLQGDKTRRFSVSFIPPQNITANQTMELNFQVYDASSGNKVLLFSRVYEKVVHLIIVDSELKYFNHIHPDQTADGFSITTQFPHSGNYHLYLDFQPLGAIEQQFAFTLDVGKVGQATLPNQTEDTNLTKNFDQYQVTLAYPKPLIASEMSIGNQRLTFTIKDSTGNPVTNLKPYLAAFGHLVMINTTTYDYLHIHPSSLIAPPANANDGPNVEFIPLGLYGPIKPGIYRVFAQFNPSGNLMLADFTVKVE